LRLIVPRRPDGGERDKLWAFCAEYWRRVRPEWEVVEGHHESGPFNRSAAINAAAEGEWDVAAILDADTIIEPDLIEEGARRAADTGRLVLPFKTRNLLSRAGTVRILRGLSGLVGAVGDRPPGARRRLRVHLRLPGRSANALG
jgi:cellulose synthase/poly-beta-1,6-N-acetylglucosamine synthase-like glycosyltransferase